jgi:uncharacterized repeat protein (TIGR03837 family)
VRKRSWTICLVDLVESDSSKVTIDIYCKVVDNWGDAGFCWRLARYLRHFENATVRLIVDGLATFTALGVSTMVAAEFGVALLDWQVAPQNELPDILIGAFACDIPDQVRTNISKQANSVKGQHCLWINLEYLSAEPWVDTHHWMPSLKPDGATEMFFVPGFTAMSGGILGEDFTKVSDDELLQAIHLPPKSNSERWVSLFCYPNAPLQMLCEVTASIKLLVPNGVDLSMLKLPPNHPVIVHRIPHLSQPQYDALLRYCDVNFVRGEDSWVRAQIAGKPFIWQPYIQSEGTHLLKLNAFCDKLELVAAPPPLWRVAMNAWSLANQSKSNPVAALLNAKQIDFSALDSAFCQWQTHLTSQTGLTTRLMHAFHAWSLHKAAT